MLYYTILYYTILYYTILYYTILYYTILYYTVGTMLVGRSGVRTAHCIPIFSGRYQRVISYRYIDNVSAACRYYAYDSVFVCSRDRHGLSSFQLLFRLLSVELGSFQRSRSIACGILRPRLLPYMYNLSLSIYIYIYVLCVYMCVYVYIYIYIACIHMLDYT